VRITRNGKSAFYTATWNTVFCSENKNIGKIIIINELTRAKTLVTKMTGAKAKLKFKNIIGSHPLFIEKVNVGKKAAYSLSNVLLLGESGTGKNVFAQAIHNESNRAEKPFVSINCAAIPRELIASELFGYAEGSFTGSRKGGNPGKFELADGGTICLDEIGEMPLELQTALLSVLEEKSIVRVGGKEVIPVDVRIIATTNRNLKEAINRNLFRADLYYRLNVIAIEMVPLRERKSDIILLTENFASLLSAKLKIKNISISREALNVLSSYSWPGYVRELQNVIERASMNITPENEITLDSLPHEVIGEPVRPVTSAQDMERQLISDMLKSDLSKSKIADKLKISRCTLYRKLKKHGIHY
jgi:transcriptional regulator with PAS, ATPase and Fis domain